MSEHRLAAGALAAAAAFGVAVAVPMSEATHFSWLGHTPCAGDKCELVPAGFIAQGEFEPHTFTIPDEIESRPEERVERLLTSDGHEIARVSTAFRRQLDDAGSARLRDGRIVNVDEKVKGQFRYLVAQNAPFGLGAPGYRLVPYRTVAVNPQRIALGTVLYIPALTGIKLPTGDFHDGFCFAHDTDPELKPNQIRLFVGLGTDDGAIEHRLTSSGRSVRVYQADANTTTTLNRRFKDQFDWSD